MSKVCYIYYVLSFVILIVLAPNAYAQIKLGVEIKQGYDAVYIADIDPSGLAAASGLMKGDSIKEINAAPLWFMYQVSDMIDNRKSDKPFSIVVKRGEGMIRIKVDPSLPAKSWPKIKDKDPLFNCYFSPTAECIIDLSMRKIKTASSIEKRFSARISAINRLIMLDYLDLARAEFEKARVEYYQLPEIRFSFSSMIRLSKSLGIEIDQKMLSYSQKKVGFKGEKIDVWALLSAAENLGEYGYGEKGIPFLMQVVDAAKIFPKLIEYESSAMGGALAATEQYDLMESYLKSDNFDSKWGSNMLEGAFLFHMEKGDIRSAEKIMLIILTFPRSTTNEDSLMAMRLLNKVKQRDLAYKKLTKLRKKTEDMDPLFRLLLARSLVKAYGILGYIDFGRKTISQYFKTNTLGPMLDLTIESANSRNSVGLAVQHYRDMPKLIAETRELLKKASAKDKRSNKIRIKKFYLVVASHLQSNLTMQEYDAYGFADYDYENMIEAFIEVRKYDEALAWTVAKEKKFGSTWKYSDLFSMYGHFAPLEKIKELKRHSKFDKHKVFIKRAYLKRLYWSGDIDGAIDLFNTLSISEKENAILGQMPFISTCMKCNI